MIRGTSPSIARQIIHLFYQLFNECGNFGLTPALLDFGHRLRSLTNEFTSLTNASAHWSDAQKMFYGKHAPPSLVCISKYCFSGNGLQTTFKLTELSCISGTLNYYTTVLD